MEKAPVTTRESTLPVLSGVLIAVGLIVMLTILGVNSAEATSMSSDGADANDADTDSVVFIERVNIGNIIITSASDVTRDNTWLRTAPVAAQEVVFVSRFSDVKDRVIFTYPRIGTKDQYVVTATPDPVQTFGMKARHESTDAPAIEYGSAQENRASDVRLVADNIDPVAHCTVEPSRIQPGDPVRISAEDSVGIAADYDITGDGTWDVVRTDRSIIEVTYNEEGEYNPRVRIWDAEGEWVVDECGTVIVSEDEFGIVSALGDYISWGLLGLAILGLGGLIWWVKIHQGPFVPDRERPVQYQTNTFEIPPESGHVTIDTVGFKPDLLLFRATNRHRGDDATDRTAGWSYGVAVRDNHAINQSILPAKRPGRGPDFASRTVTVADDANSTDRATCVSHDDRVLDLIKHGTSGPGRITARVTETTADGFELDVSVPEDAPTAGGIRVLYQAFQLGSGAATVGHTHTPVEPGNQQVELDVDADHVEVTACTGATPIGTTATTDGGIGLSVGRANAEEGGVRETVWGASAWPGTTAGTTATCYDDRVIALLFQDADRITGRVRARATGLGDKLGLTFDEVDTRPDVGGPTDGHVLTYVAIDSGEQLCPAIGTFRFPAPGGSTALDVGFEPGLVELETVAAEPGEERVSRASAQPFDWSHGTATRENDTIIQYVLHQSVAPPRTADSGAAPPMVPADNEHASPMAADGGDEGTYAPGRANIGGDGFAASWLVQHEDGRIVGRDDLRVTSITETGFTVAVETVSTDQREDSGLRPTVLYRVWPVAEAPERDGSRSAVTDGTPSDRA